MEDLSLSVCRKVSVVVTVSESFSAVSDYNDEDYFKRNTPRHSNESNQVCIFPVIEESSPQKSLKGSTSKSLLESPDKVYRGESPTKSFASAPAAITTATIDSRDLIVVNPTAFGKHIPVSITMDTARLVAEIAKMPSEDWARTYKFHQVLWSNSGNSTNKTDALHNICQAVVNDLLAPGSIAHRILLGTATGLVAVPQQTQQLFGTVGNQSVARVFAQQPDTRMAVADILERYGIAGLTAHGILERLSNSDSFECTLSVLEISDEEMLFDLLASKPFAVKGVPRVKIGYEEAGAFVTDLSEAPIESLKHVGHLIRRAFTAALHKNRRSGRGHVVVTVNVVAKHDRSKRTSCQFVDLAAVERGDSSAFVRRSAAIRKSLWALGGVLRGTLLKEAGNDAPISYRESLLTKVLQRSMMQTDSRTIVLASVSPDTSQYEETMTTLRYVNRLLYRPGQLVHSPFASLDSNLSKVSSPTSLTSLHTKDPLSHISMDQFAGQESVLLQELVSDPRQRLAKVMKPVKQMTDVVAPQIEKYIPTEYNDPLSADRPPKATLRDQGSIISASPRESEALIELEDDWTPADSALPTPLASNGSGNHVKSSAMFSPEPSQMPSDDEDDAFYCDNQYGSAKDEVVEQDEDPYFEHPPDVSPLTADTGRASRYNFPGSNPFDDSQEVENRVYRRSAPVEEDTRGSESNDHRARSFAMAGYHESQTGRDQLYEESPRLPVDEYLSEDDFAANDDVEGMGSRHGGSVEVPDEEYALDETRKQPCEEAPQVTGYESWPEKELSAKDVENTVDSLGKDGRFSSDEYIIEPDHETGDPTPAWDDEISHLSQPSRSYGSIEEHERWDRPVDQPADGDELERILRETRVGDDEEFTNVIPSMESEQQTDVKSLESLLREPDSEPDMNHGWGNGKYTAQQADNMTFEQILRESQNDNDGHLGVSLGNDQRSTVEMEHGGHRIESKANGPSERPQLGEVRSRESKIPTPLKQKWSRMIETGSLSSEGSIRSSSFDKTGRLLQQHLSVAPTVAAHHETHGEDSYYVKPGIRQQSQGMPMISRANSVENGHKSSAMQSAASKESPKVFTRSTVESVFEEEDLLTAYDLPPESPIAKPCWAGKAKDALDHTNGLPTLVSETADSTEDGLTDIRGVGVVSSSSVPVPTRHPSAAADLTGDGMLSNTVSGVANSYRVPPRRPAARPGNGMATSSKAVNQPGRPSVAAVLADDDLAARGVAYSRSVPSQPSRSSAKGYSTEEDVAVRRREHPATAKTTSASKNQWSQEARADFDVSHISSTSDRNVLDEIDELQAAVDKVKQTNISVWQSSLASIDNLRHFHSSQQEAVAQLLVERDKINKEIERLENELDRQSESHRFAMIQLEEEIEVALAEIEKVKLDRGEVVKIAEEAIATQAELEQRVTELEEELLHHAASSVPRDDYHALEGMNAALEQEVEEVKRQVLHYNRELGDRNLVISELQVSLESLEEERRVLVDDLSKRLSEIESLNEALANARVNERDVVALRSEVSRLTKEIQSIQSASRRREAELQREQKAREEYAQQCKREAESANMELAAVHEEAQSEAIARQSEISRLGEELDLLQNELVAYPSKLQDEEQRFADLQLNRDVILQELEQTRTALDSRIADVQELTINLKSLLSAKDKDQSKIVRMEIALASFQDETRSRVEKVVRHRNEAASLLEKTVNENKALVETNQQLQAAVEELRRELDDSKIQARGLSAHIANRGDVAMKENDALAEANQQLRLELESLRREHGTNDDYTANRVYRMTGEDTRIATESFRPGHAFDLRSGRSSRPRPTSLRSEFEAENAFDRPDPFMSRGPPVELSDLQRAEEVAAYVAFSAKSKMETNSTETHHLKEKLFALEDAKDEEINSLKTRIKSLERRFGGSDRRRGSDW